MYADDLVLGGKLEELMMGHFVEVCMLKGEKRLECEVCVGGIRL